MLSQRITLPRLRAPKRLAIVGAALLLSALDVPVTPAQQIAAIARPAVEIVLSVAPPSGGTVIELTVPADQWPTLHPAVIERPGLERRIRR